MGCIYFENPLHVGCFLYLVVIYIWISHSVLLIALYSLGVITDRRHWILNESKSHQFFRSLLTVLNNTVISTSLILPWIISSLQTLFQFLLDCSRSSDYNSTRFPVLQQSVDIYLVFRFPLIFLWILLEHQYRLANKFFF